ncbi:MAG: hypothetical protein ABR600_03335 [Actinomycetota bacterium]
MDAAERRRSDRRFVAGWILAPTGIAMTLFFSMVVVSTLLDVFGPEGCVPLEGDAMDCSMRAALSASLPGLLGLVAGALVALWGFVLARR